MLNWALELSEYEFDIVHIPSKFNTISDCLSRLERVCSVLQMPSLLSKQALLSAQENDRKIQEAIKYLKQNEEDFPVQQLRTLKRFRKQLHKWSSIVEDQNRNSNTAKTRNFTIVITIR